MEPCMAPWLRRWPRARGTGSAPPPGAPRRAGPGATPGVATTGGAGPAPAEGKPVGMVFVAVAGPGGLASRQLALTGDRAEIRAAVGEGVLGLLGGGLQEHVV